MIGRLRFWTLLTVSAGLLCGSAVRAQGITQSTNVTYAVTLVDADASKKGANGAWAPVDRMTQRVYVQVTVSVPRSEGVNTYTIPAIARPAGLMFRAHSGADGTAWAHSISLVRDAPYGTDGKPSTTAFYPMPQKADAPTNLRAVLSGSATNVDGTAYATYLRSGRGHDPARWEATYISSKAYDVADPQNALVASLLAGEATQEWYAASEYGLGSFARISPIQDLGRAMDFSDLRLWQGAKRHDDITIDTASQASFGNYDEMWVRAMPGSDGPTGSAYGWRIVRGAIGANAVGQVGAQLFNTYGTGDDRTGGAAIESPVYPDGISSVTFEALASDSNAAEDGSAQILELWYRAGAMATEVCLKRFELTTGARTYSADFVDADGKPLARAGSNARFFLRRATANTNAGMLSLVTVVVRNLRVTSAAPAAEFGKATVAATTSDVRAWAGVPFDVSFTATTNGTYAASLPRGYSATLRLRRRAEGDNTALWRSVAMQVSGLNPSGDATVRASFTPGSLVTNAGDGTVNAAEGAFFTDAQTGEVTGVMPGVYDMALDYSVYGSFKAGREQMDAREAVSGTKTGVSYVSDSGQTLEDPYLLDVRERRTARPSVSLRVMYKGRAENGTDNAICTVDVPCLSSSTEDYVWRVALPKTLRLSDYGLPDDEAAEYAWGYQASEDADPVFSVGYLPFSVVVRESDSEDAEEVVYGQDGASAAGVLPPVSEAVPAMTQRLVRPASAADVVPVVVPIDGLDASHLLAEVVFSDTEGASVRLCGAYWQDFNTWFASNGFGQTDFRENVTSVTAGFNCTTTTNESEAIVVDRGWIPDEGPLADSTSFTEDFAMSRESQTDSGLPFALPNETYQASEHFAMWGAAPEQAQPYLLRPDRDKYNDTSLYMVLGNNTELVANRNFTRAPGGMYLPDAQVRLRDGRGTLTPRTDADGVLLSGVGTVSFRLGLSLPYDIQGIAQFRNRDGSLIGDKYGISAGIAFDSGSTALNATSGYSVSYYLIDDNATSSKKYELRLTQTISFDDKQVGTDGEREPSGQVVAELYEWSKGQDLPARMTIVDSTGADIPQGYRVVGDKTLSSMRAALWVRSDGTLAVGIAVGNLTGTPTLQFRSTKALGGDVQLTPALGSAECRPIFRSVSFATSRADSYVNGVYPTTETVYVHQADNGTSWQLTADADGASRVQLRRATPSKDQSGRVRIRASGDNKNKEVSTTLSGETFTVTLGSAKGSLVIEPVDGDSVFLDDITVSSWCGNDQNRNGEARVPRNTDVGFYQNNGFAGVGIWVRPEEDEQLSVSPWEYTGRQCVLLQRSRRNTSYTSSETTEGADDGTNIRHTGSTLALYSPWSDKGFGTVSFRYRIPQLDEFGSGQENRPVSLMLQYKETQTANLSWLGDNPGTGWQNVTAPFDLENTAGEWRSMSITPKLNGQELVGKTGNLRLVMVTTGLEDSDDPYVYIDDLTFTDNQGTSASWRATNVKLTDSPIDLLYWKDRAATEGTLPEETDFAHKSSLTRAMQFNNVMTDGETEGSYGVADLRSPLLEEGVGRVTFAARRTVASPEPVRVYFEFSTDTNEDTDEIDWETLTYVDVTNTVYRVFDVDLSKFRRTLTPIDPVTLLPGTPLMTSTPFDHTAVRRLRLRTRLENDNGGDDAFDEAPRTGRILLDMLTVSNPVTASLRVRSVMFSNIAGTGRAGFERQLKRLNAGQGMSPLSQPVTGTSALRVMVALDRMQQVRADSVRVFLTYDLNSVEGGGKLARLTSYNYTDVFGNTFSADSSAPIYTWQVGDEASWPLDAWFDADAAHAAVTAGGLPANTIELSAVTSDDGGEVSLFVGDLSKDSGIPELKANSLVRYVAWAVYESEEDEPTSGDDEARTLMSKQEASAYTEFPWYFPRSLNAEIRARYNEANPDASAGSSFFSPYFWIYSCLPGEVFLSEFNIVDNGSAISLRPFVEFCAPVNMDLGGWGIEIADRAAALQREIRFRVPVVSGDEGVKLPAPETGVVPAKRVADTSANRSFYTAKGSFDLYWRNGGSEVVLGDTETNAGIAASGYEGYRPGSNTTAGALLLFRPTGGAEHVVVFSNINEANITDSSRTVAQENINALYGLYQSAYINHGFGGEWAQEFVDEGENWDGLSDADRDNISAEDHARRLTKADVFMADENADYTRTGTGTSTFVQDYAKTAFANSMASVDMGGKWVTRLNHANERANGGPTDLTHLMQWTGAFNPADQARAEGKQIQVTPRQINPDQYLFRYTGLNQNTVTSTITGLGTHTLSYTENAGEATTERIRQAGREPQVTWSVNATVDEVTLTYTPLLFHVMGEVKLRFMDAKEGLQITDEGKIRAALAEATEAYTIGTDGMVTFTPADAATGFAVKVNLQGAAEEERYNLEFSTSFTLDVGRAKDVLTSVRPYCGTAFPGTANEQPWWGGSFGFAVDYDKQALGGDFLSSVLVTYPSPVAPGYLVGPEPDVLGHGLAGAWSGTKLEVADETGGASVTYGLDGMEYASATNLLATVFAQKAGTRFVELKGAAEGRVADSSVVGILSDAYATKAGYVAGQADTYAKKEPAIPFCVWGVYTVPVVSDFGNEKVSFLVRQPTLRTKPGLFTKPHRYEPLEDLNASASRPEEETAPYFYLYSTPPQSAWLNELNLVQASSGATEGNSAPYAEVVMPYLRDGITGATPPVPQADAAGWTLRRYGEDGAAVGTAVSLAGASVSDSSSASYKYNTVTILAETLGKVAYVLHRPCGAAEGGVWTGVDGQGGTVVPVPGALSQNTWLLPAADRVENGEAVVGSGSYVVAGVTDSSATAGSIQLTGELMWVDDVVQALPSDVTKRTKWEFLGETSGTDNKDGSVIPDTKPVWNQVTITSTLRNTVYEGTACGYHVFGFLAGETVSGASGIDVTLEQTLGGPEWVYSADKAKVFSYRPRSNYCFESLQVPQDLIGKIMLIGTSGPLTEEDVAAKVAELRALADNATSLEERTRICTEEWIRMGGQDTEGNFRATAETRLEYDESGNAKRVFTGVIRFNPDFIQGIEEDDTFGNDSDFTITVVFAEEPASAQNAMVMSFGQGEIRAGAWLFTQTLFAIDENGEPIQDKGGVAVDDPIWTDENGTASGEYANLHGWLYQPTTGDRLGMAAVISPEDGLKGGDLSDPYGMLVSGDLRPYLVWTLIPKAKVPTNLFVGDPSGSTRSNFMKGWDLAQWITTGAPLPTIGDRNPYGFSTLRQNLKKQLPLDNSLFSAAGIIPMMYTGKNTDAEHPLAPASGALHFRTLKTQAELDALGLTTAENELPFSLSIDMSDATLWQDGAVARFAIVLVDKNTNQIRDCQSISNFTSEVQPAYCPWYVPDASSNINVVTRREQVGVSPYFWVYAIGQGDVWINEFRPFAVGTGAPSAFELGMLADTGIKQNDLGHWVPSKTLDGWKVAVKAAPMPTPDTPETETLAWISSEDSTGPLAGRSVELKGWIPFRRIRSTTADPSDSGFYDLDFYLATTNAKEGALQGDNSLANNPYDPNDPESPNTFQWLKMAQELLPEGITQTLESEEAYRYGVVYAIQLIRSNGVVADEVLFTNKVNEPSEAEAWWWKNRLQKAVEMESAAGQCAGTVRSVGTVLPPTGNDIGTATAQFVEAKTPMMVWNPDAVGPDGGQGAYEPVLDDENNPVYNTELKWFVSTDKSRTYTLAGANEMPGYYGVDYHQPYADYLLPDRRLASLTARLVGGDARLSLVAGEGIASGRNVGGLYSKGIGYTLSVEGWDPRWFNLKGVTKNGSDFAPSVEAARRSVYALAANGTVRTTQNLTLDVGTLERDTDYSVIFVYTPSAELLEASGALESTDDGFLEWLRQADPDAILEQSAADGVSASEKYWLGFDSADWDASDVALTVVSIGTQTEPAGEGEVGEVLPTLTLRLAKGEEPIGALQGDGVAVLLGKTNLDEPWRFVQELQPQDLSGERTLVVTSDCRFFKAVLLSRRQVQEIKRN